MHGKFACWSILTTFRTDQIMVTVGWFFKFWHYFDLVKRVKFGVSGHFLENPLRKWPEILHADVSWSASELKSLLLIFLILALYWNGSNLGVPVILVMLCGFYSLWCPFDWNWSYLGFLDIIWRTCGSKCRGGSGGVLQTLCVQFCLVHSYFAPSKHTLRVRYDKSMTVYMVNLRQIR